MPKLATLGISKSKVEHSKDKMLKHKHDLHFGGTSHAALNVQQLTTARTIARQQPRREERKIIF
jgi:hypothetical protein